MPILPVGSDHIHIKTDSWDKLSTDNDISKLEEMSTEFALWLQSCLIEQKSPTLATVNERAFESDTPYRRMVSRCLEAGRRGYLVPYVSNTDKLLPSGWALADRANRTLNEIMEYEPRLHVVDEWTKAEQIILYGTLPLRTLNLLQTVINAIFVAETKYQQELEKRVQAGHDVQTALIPPNGRVLQFNPFLDELSGDLTNLDNDNTKTTYHDTTDKISNVYNTNSIGVNQELDNVQRWLDFRNPATKVEKTREPIQTKNYRTAMLKLDDSTKRHAAIPTAIFLDRARMDLRILYRYGLVDLGGYRDGGRGRPKFVLRPSRPGITLMSDLLQRGIIQDSNTGTE